MEDLKSKMKLMEEQAIEKSKEMQENFNEARDATKKITLEGNYDEEVIIYDSEMWVESSKAEYSSLISFGYDIRINTECLSGCDIKLINKKVVTYGNNSLTFVGENTTVCGFGNDSYVGLNNSFDKVVSNSRVFFSGDYSSIYTYYPVIDSIFINTGENTGIYSTGPKGTRNNIGISTASNSDVSMGFEKSYAITLGDESRNSIYGENNISFNAGDNSFVSARENNIIFNSGDDCSIYVDSNNVILNSGENSKINAGKNTILFLLKNPEYFSVDSNSMIAIVWNDGTRDRIMVLYAGEGGIESGKFYKVAQNGQVVEVNSLS